VLAHLSQTAMNLTSPNFPLKTPARSLLRPGVHVLVARLPTLSTLEIPKYSRTNTKRDRTIRAKQFSNKLNRFRRSELL
jgi:hypothetical protein